MSPVTVLRVRDAAQSNLTPTMVNLLIALVVLFAAVALLTSGLLILRSIRRSKKQETLPSYNESRRSLMRGSTLTINAPAYVVAEKQNLIDNSCSLPGSPSVPEIRITFPEEVDESGKRKSGRVVVVTVGDHTVGMEPVSENLPPYQQSDSDRFQSLDLDRIGGLKEIETEVEKEKVSEKQWS